MSTDTTDTERRELLTFLQGKTIAGLRFDALPGGAFDIIFTDHSELEMYNIAGRFSWVPMTAEEVAEQEARDTAGLRELEAQIAAGQAPLFEHAEVWAEVDAEEAREAELLALARRAFDEDQPAVMTAAELIAAVEQARGESLDLPQMPRE